MAWVDGVPGGPDASVRVAMMAVRTVAELVVFVVLFVCVCVSRALKLSVSS